MSTFPHMPHQLCITSTAGISTQTKIDEDQPTLSLYASISALYHFHVKINSLLWSRKIHLEHKPNIKFSLGQIVSHKIYGYRGVIIAWDHKPHVDVTNWDGLQHVDNPQNQPFYHIRPDENDCIRAFGGPRSFRYVCQDNLELCEATGLQVDDLNPREWKWDKEKGCYIPSDEMKVCSFSRVWWCASIFDQFHIANILISSSCTAKYWSLTKKWWKRLCINWEWVHVHIFMHESFRPSVRLSPRWYRRIFCPNAYYSWERV